MRILEILHSPSKRDWSRNQSRSRALLSRADYVKDLGGFGRVSGSTPGRIGAADPTSVSPVKGPGKRAAGSDNMAGEQHEKPLEQQPPLQVADGAASTPAAAISATPCSAFNGAASSAFPPSPVEIKCRACEWPAWAKATVGKS
jgi:hypothetical protein